MPEARALAAEDVIALLELVPLPSEGGHFRETYRSARTLDAMSLPPRDGAARALATAIFYLLTPATFSAFHRLPGDEIFHYYLGDPVELTMLAPEGAARRVVLGPDLRAGHELQVVVPGGTWQGSRLIPGGRWGLLGTTMSPGFDFADLELGDRQALIRDYPGEAAAITALTGPGGGPASGS